MAGVKALQGVAHDIGQNFTSLMNYADGDYVMGHILRLARKSGRDTMTINLLSGNAEPAELLDPVIAPVPSRYMKWFWKLLQSYGSDRVCVSSATMRLHFDLTKTRQCEGNPVLKESPYTCNVRIVSTSGKEYAAQFDGWWFPERG